MIFGSFDIDLGHPVTVFGRQIHTLRHASPVLSSWSGEKRTAQRSLVVATHVFPAVAAWTEGVL